MPIAERRDEISLDQMCAGRVVKPQRAEGVCRVQAASNERDRAKTREHRLNASRLAAAASVALMVGLSCLVALLPLAPAHADWQDDLRHQLRDEYNCDIAYLTRLEVRKVEGHEIVFVRAHCTDARSFDASRHSEDERFRIKACDVQAC